MYGSWGALEYMDQSYDEAYKYQALAEYNTASVHGEKIHPLSFDLLPAFPNPFNSSTTIEFSLARTDWVDLSIYNIRGQKVQTLTANRFAAGIYSVRWDARDEAEALSSGVYFYVMSTASGFRQTQRLLFLK